eukprot:1140702-Pelagomonas_calceolata.AAC.7
MACTACCSKTSTCPHGPTVLCIECMATKDRKLFCMPFPCLTCTQALRALGSSVHARGSRSLLLKDNDVSTWANCAVAAYRDMATKGWKPNYDVLNM